MQITNETHTMHIVNHLKDTCANHDWYFQMANGDAYYAGLRVASEINYLKNVLIARGYKQQVETLIANYRPKMPVLEELLKPVPRTMPNPKSYPRAELNILCDWRLHDYSEDSSFVNRLMELGYSEERAVELMAEYEVDYEAWRKG
jgi:hypothetical protein